MGKSHFTSDVIGKGSAKVASMLSVTASTLTGGSAVTAGNYLRVGTAGYLFFSTSGADTSATIVAEAVAKVATPIKGSLTLSNAGVMWVHNSDTTASKINEIA